VTGHWTWAALGLLGAYHGLNPAMGWLFAVALGFQDGSRSGVLRALPPIAAGHAVSVGLVALLAGLAQLAVGPAALRLVGAAVLILFGLGKLLRPRLHPRWVGMRVGARQLVLWSFLMSTAHGAGLMLLPLLIGRSPLPAAHAGYMRHADHVGSATMSLAQAGAATLFHSAAMFAVMALVAVLVYDRLGLGVLRTAWLNTDTAWAVTLIAAGLLTLAL
jgi:hypothetical protein